MNLLESVRRWALANLPYDRSDLALVAYLNGLDAGRLLIAYHNWMNRFVKPQLRVVHQSEALQRNPLTTTHAADIALLIADIEQGRDLTRYLSRDVMRAPVKVPGKRRPDLDLMLNGWGIHHLHISSIIESDGFVKRDGPLLFVRFKPADAYVIDIMGHRDWTRDHVLEVLAGEWPNEGLVLEMKGILPSSTPFMEEQRATLRKNHYNMSFSHAGKAFVPAAGLTGDGTTIAAMLATQILLRKIRKFEQALTKDPRCLVPDFERAGLRYPETPEFEFEIKEGESGVLEKKTGAWMNLTEKA